MKKNLRKKLLRDLRQSAVQFTAIFVMCFLAMFMMTAFEAEISGTDNSVNEYFSDTNFADINVSSEGFTNDDLAAVKNLPEVKNAEFRTALNGKVSLPGGEKKMEFNFIEENDISRMLLSEGTPYQPEMSGIWIDTDFAKAQNISVGDTLKCTCGNVEFAEKVMGMIDSSDHLYFVIDDTYTEPDKGAYGYAYLDAKEYPGEELIFDTIFVDLNTVDGQLFIGDDEKELISAASEKIKQTISKEQLICTKKQNVTAFEYIHDDMETHTMLGTVFPVLFITISLLGIMSTMTRLVEKQRTLIGTLKALGFSRNAVILHYTSYSVVVALLGSVAGSVAGWYTLGKYITYMMNTFYCNPYSRMELSPKIFIITAAVCALAGLTNYLSCRKLLVQRASEILKPAPPATQGAGPVEKTFIWKKLSFAAKWNIRDISRNRIRTLVGFFGIALSAALVFTAFGANELLGSVGDWQYSELNTANYMVMFSYDTAPDVVYDYARQFDGQMVMSLSTELFSGDNHSLENVTVTDEGNLYNYQNSDGEYIDLPAHGFALSSNVADDYGIGVGDMVSFRIPGEKKLYSGRAAIIYTAPSAQGIAMTRKYFESLGAEFRPNILYTNKTVPASYATEREEITSIFDKAALIRALEKDNELTSTEVMYIMAIAVAMGIVIMYNLGVMSFSEKVREIATLKVLGFSTKKIRWILQQQNIAVTGAGTLAGLLLGKKVLMFMMDNLDDEAAFIFHISPQPYAMAVIISFVLSIAVNEIISSKVKDINMVDALKGVE